jgi:hypothetical protein
MFDKLSQNQKLGVIGFLLGVLTIIVVVAVR